MVAGTTFLITLCVYRATMLPGIGAWSVDHVAMRSLGDPDVFLPTDIGVRRAAERLGTDLPGVVAASEAWRPWRSYALTHLWQVATTVGAPA